VLILRGAQASGAIAPPSAPPERTQLRSSGDDAKLEWPKNKQDRATRAEHALLTDN
jgi:hypothetical protein